MFRERLQLEIHRRSDQPNLCSTEAHDKMGPIGVDPRWEVFVPFHTYLLTAFPLV